MWRSGDVNDVDSRAKFVSELAKFEFLLAAGRRRQATLDVFGGSGRGYVFEKVVLAYIQRGGMFRVRQSGAPKEQEETLNLSVQNVERNPLEGKNLSEGYEYWKTMEDASEMELNKKEITVDCVTACPNDFPLVDILICRNVVVNVKNFSSSNNTIIYEAKSIEDALSKIDMKEPQKLRLYTLVHPDKFDTATVSIRGQTDKIRNRVELWVMTFCGKESESTRASSKT